jgi:glutathione S-transferase
MAESQSAAKRLKPSSLKLHYADMNFWRAECVRMAFFIGGIDFEDVRDGAKELRAQGRLTFGAVPVLEVDGQILSQTSAMAVYAARMAGIHPTEDPWLAAKVDECLSGCTDVTGTIGTTFRIKDPDEKIAARKALVDTTTNKESPGRLWIHLHGLDKICAENGCPTGFSVGNSLTVADLAIWRLVGWVDSGVLDGIPNKYATDTFPALAKVVTAVDANPKVKEWKEKYPKLYSKK